jgi:hypothetical protein
MSFTIKTAEGIVVTIEDDYGNAAEYTMFLNEVSEIEGEGAGEYTITKTTNADRVELAAQEAE